MKNPIYLVLTSLLAGCAPVALAPEFEALEDGVDLQGAVHVHLDRSKPFEEATEELFGAALVDQIGFIVLIDDGFSPEQKAILDERTSPVIIPAVELENGLLAVGLWRPLPPTATADDIRKKGGLALRPLARGAAWDLNDADGAILYDLEEAVSRKVRDLAKWRTGIPKHKGTAILAELDPEVLGRWDELSRGRRVLGLASHSTFHGRRAQLTMEESLNLLANGLRARKADRAGILEAIRQGQSSILFKSVDDYGGVLVTVAPEPDRGTMLSVSWAGNLSATQRIYRDGRPVELELGPMMGFGLSFLFKYRLTQAGQYRVLGEVKVEDEGTFPWFLTNPVRVVEK